MGLIKLSRSIWSVKPPSWPMGPTELAQNANKIGVPKPLLFFPFWRGSGAATEIMNGWMLTHASGATRPTWRHVAGEGLTTSIDSVQDEWQTPGTVAHNIGTGSFTIVCRIKAIADPNTYHCLLANGIFAPGFYARLSGSAWGLYLAGDKTANTTIAAGNTYTLGVSRKGSTYSFFVNGHADGTNVSAPASIANAVISLGNNGQHSGPHIENMFWAGVWKEPFTPAQHAAVHGHLLFAPPARKLFIDVAAPPAGNPWYSYAQQHQQGGIF